MLSRSSRTRHNAPLVINEQDVLSDVSTQRDSDQIASKGDERTTPKAQFFPAYLKLPPKRMITAEEYLTCKDDFEWPVAILQESVDPAMPFADEREPLAQCF
jgi:hypothetical protein